jgi:hypothetical protein
MQPMTRCCQQRLWISAYRVAPLLSRSFYASTRRFLNRVRWIYTLDVPESPDFESEEDVRVSSDSAD